MRTIGIVAVAALAPVGFALAGGQRQTEFGGACAKGQLTLVKAGQLTIGTDNPAFPPWFGGGEKTKPWKFNDPNSGQGYESAVAYEVARRLGFPKAQVKWTVVPFLKSFAPGKKSFDVFFNQVSYSAERAKNVDFSASYYNVQQAVVAVKGTPIAKVKTAAGLKPFRLGAPLGTTSLSIINSRVNPTSRASVFDTLDLAAAALGGKTIDGLVVDLPTGFFITGSGQVKDSLIVGQFPTSGAQEYFGAVLAKGSSLTPCVTRAIRQMRADGTLKRIETRWLAKGGAPFLK